MSSSAKFKILFDLYRHDELKDYLVPYIRMDEVSEDSITLGENYILRSALKNETSEKLNSGVGQSIDSVRSFKEFLAAKEIISKQETLDFAILQPYWKFEKHITLLLDGDIFYGDVLGHKEEFIMQGSATSSGDKDLLKVLNQFIQKISTYIHGPVILELGIKGKELKLFQVSEVKDRNIKGFVHHELFYRAAQAQNEFNKAGFFKKLQIEFKAKKFREQNPKVSLGNVLENWLFIFHYYRLYCIQHKLSVGNLSFEKYLNSMADKNHVAQLASWHIQKANDFRVEEGLPEVESYFEVSGVVYLGKGQKTFKFGESAIHLENLTAKQIIANKDKLILSTYNAILGHPCLLMAQENISFVGGLSLEQLESISAGDEISVDFNLRKLEVKSL